MACVELGEGNYQSLKDLKKSEAQRSAQKRVRELNANGSRRVGRESGRES